MAPCNVDCQIQSCGTWSDIGGGGSRSVWSSALCLFIQTYDAGYYAAGFGSWYSCLSVFVKHEAASFIIALVLIFKRGLNTIETLWLRSHTPESELGQRPPCLHIEFLSFRHPAAPVRLLVCREIAMRPAKILRYVGWRRDRFEELEVHIEASP
jgi:hypothetical protein